MSFPVHQVVCCPVCRSELSLLDESSLCCQACFQRYPIRLGIPDLRVISPDRCGYANTSEDLRAAEKLFAYALAHSYQETVTWWVDSFAAPATRDVHLQFRLSNPAKADELGRRLSEWTGGTGLDVGCGSGGGILGMLRLCDQVVAVDVQLSEMICARKMLEELGLASRVCFVAASAEALPIKTSSLSAVVALDVFEHVSDQRRFVSEGHRTLCPGGVFYFQTPSRYKWMETHYMLPGLGYLPLRLQKLYVRFFRNERDYPIHLVGLGQLKAILSSCLPLASWRVQSAPVINLNPKRIGWKGRLLRQVPGWHLFVRLCNHLAAGFTSFHVFVRRSE